jgi:purine-binding chemotaxis protein CheW
MKSNLALTSKKHSEIDWAAVRRQMDEADEKLKTSQAIDLVALEQAWARRSAKLAQKLQEEEQGETFPMAIVGLDDERYGLDARHVFDIRVLERITPVPRTPPWVLGVVNWRGRVLSVIDLRRFWGLPSSSVEKKGRESARLVVVQSGEMEVGIWADQVFSIELVPVSKIQAEVGELRSIKPELVHGIFLRTVQNGQEPVLLLNLPALLAHPRLIIQEEI